MTKNWLTPDLLVVGQDSTERVQQALEASGYSPEGILSAVFETRNVHHEEVHRVNFYDDNGELDHGHVFIDQAGKAEY